MMSNRVTRRYASAFFNLTEKKNLTEKAVENAEVFLELCSSSRDFELLLKSPVIRINTKKSFFQKIFSGIFCEETISFIALVTDHKRENLLMEIFTDFLKLYKDSRGIVTAELITAIEADEEISNKIISLIKKLSNCREVELIRKIDPTIIGGFRIKYHDKLLDASIAHELKEISKRMKK